MLRWIHPGDFVRGLLYPLRGLEILRRHGGLRRYWLPPIALTCAALVASLVLAVRYHGELVELLWHVPAGETVLDHVLRGLHFLLRALVLLVSAALGTIGCLALANLFAAPFNDALSERIEELETGSPAPPFSWRRLLRDLGRTLRLELLKLAIYLLVMGPLLVASFALPGAGQVLYTVFAALFSAVYLAIDYLDWPASRRALPVRRRLSLLTVRPLMTLGFGFAVAGCLFLPLLNLFLMPIAVAGGTRLFLDLEQYAEQDA